MSQLSLYEQVLGASYGRLPAAVQRFHRLTGYTLLHGWVEIKEPGSLLARLLALCLGAPRRGGNGSLRFELEASPQAEIWTRHFPTRTMTSRLQFAAGTVEERLGAARLTFGLTASKDKLSMTLLRMRFYGVPCPRWLLPRVVAEERGIGDQLHFDVHAALPIVGTVAHYRGHLAIPK